MNIEKIKIITLSTILSLIFIILIENVFESFKHILNTSTLGIFITIYTFLLGILFTLLTLTYSYRINNKNQLNLNKIKIEFDDLTSKLESSIYELFINLIIITLILFLISDNITKILQMSLTFILLLSIFLTFFNIASIFYSFKELYIYLKNN